MDEMLRLLNRLRPRIERLGGGKDEGEELYAEVALACVEKRQRYDWSHPEIEGRVISMATNLRIRRLRRERMRKHACLPAEECRALACDAAMIEDTPSTVCIACREAINRLPDRYREVVDEQFYAGRRMSSIAKAMGLPSATIRTRSRRALTTTCAATRAFGTHCEITSDNDSAQQTTIKNQSLSSDL